MSTTKLFDALPIEQKLDSVYDQFILETLKEPIKTIRLANFNCSSKCVDPHVINQTCVKECEKAHAEYFATLELRIKNAAQQFEDCKLKCGEDKGRWKACLEGCVDIMKRYFESTSNDLVIKQK